ncbi:MAG: two-component sensor histidine kinase [Flavobacteriaceae bacterium]|nr:two-component sensor histidine kinase [Flavobacteriaceae bacterium]
MDFVKEKITTYLKLIWPFLAFVFVVLILWNTNILFQKFKNEQRLKMELWAKAQKDIIENKNPNSLTFQVLQQTGINPIIRVDSKGKIIDHKNLDEVFNDSISLYRSLEKIRKENKPIIIQYKDPISGRLLIDQKLYYGDSLILKKLQYYPLSLFLIIVLFGLLLYFIFKTNKISEQNKLWAAMAKETAHQIGTPLSSLIGWTTLIKDGQNPKVSVMEMEKDIDRLRIITERFSKIGSDPILELHEVNSIIIQTVNYIQKRSSNLIKIKTSLTKKSSIVPINTQLLSWTLENLIKNGIDSLKGVGEIVVSSKLKNKKLIILIQDNGNGIDPDNFKKIFLPGFTTKKRGWGLGLSLAKRIIRDYHKGKIYVKESLPKKSTILAIELIKED